MNAFMFSWYWIGVVDNYITTHLPSNIRCIKTNIFLWFEIYKRTKTKKLFSKQNIILFGMNNIIIITLRQSYIYSWFDDYKRPRQQGGSLRRKVFQFTRPPYCSDYRADALTRRHLMRKSANNWCCVLRVLWILVWQETEFVMK